MKSSVMERPMAKGHGTFVLPGIASDVPIAFGTKSSAEKLLARFALAAEDAGIPLTGGKYQGLTETVKDQFESWLSSLLTADSQLLAGRPNLEISDSRITFFVEAGSDLRLMRLKSVIEDLEAAEPGLGWYVVHVLECTGGHGMPIYGPSIMGYESDGYLEGAVTDEEFAVAMYEMDNGDKPSPDLLPKLISDARQNYAYLPSDLSAAVDGHVHLIGWSQKGKRPKTLKRRQVLKAIKSESFPPALVKCVRDAMNLELLFKHDKERLFSWNQVDDHDSIGAVLFMAWDDPHLLLELVEHYETGQYESGYAMEWLTRISVDGNSTDDELKQLARNLRVYFQQWNALATLVSNFPSE